jgi:hypothetical protein
MNFFDRHQIKSRSLTTLDKSRPLKTNPHYTDDRFKTAQTVFGNEPKSPHGHSHLEYVYSDRIRQWDWDKAESAREIANKSGYQKASCFWYESFLSTYLDKQVKIEHILAGVNWSSGYSYYVLGYKIVT